MAIKKLDSPNAGGAELGVVEDYHKMLSDAERELVELREVRGA